MSGTVIHQPGAVRLEIGDQIADVLPQGCNTLDVANTLGVGPAVESGELDQALFPPSMPKTPLRALRKRKPTPTFRHGPGLSRLLAVMGEAV